MTHLLFLHGVGGGHHAWDRQLLYFSQRGYAAHAWDQPGYGHSAAVEPYDFERFEMILAMDRENLEALRRRAPAQARDRVQLFLEFAPEAGTKDVPDPYYGGPNGFEEVLDLVEAAARGLLRRLRQGARAA